MDVMVSSPSAIHNGGTGILQDTSTEKQDRLIAAEVMTKFSHYASKSEKSVPIVTKYVDDSSKSCSNFFSCSSIRKKITFPATSLTKISIYKSPLSINQKQNVPNYEKLPRKENENNGIPQSLKIEQQQQQIKDIVCLSLNPETSTDNLDSPTSEFVVNTTTTTVNNDNNNAKNVSDNSAEQMIDISSQEKEKSTNVPVHNVNSNNTTNCTNKRTIRKNSLPVLNVRILKELLDSTNNQGLVYLIHPFHTNFLVRSINKKDFINSFLKVKQKSGEVIEPPINELLASSETPIWGVIKKNRTIHFFEPPPKESKELHNTNILVEHTPNRSVETNEIVWGNSEHPSSEKLASTLPLKKRKIADSLLKGSAIPSALPYLFTPEDPSKQTKSISQIAEECIKDRSVFIISPSDVPKFVKAALSKPWGNTTNQQLAKNIEIALSQDEDGDLPLHIATVQKDLKMVNLYGMLIQRAGKSVDRYNKKNLTPLHLCVKVKFLEGLQKLIQMGADVNALDGNGQSALHIAVSNSDLECFEFLLQQSTIYIKDTKMKPNFNSHDYEGMTLLHTAVNNNDIKMVDRLLQIGAELDAIDFKSGRTPLFHAVENNNMEIIKFLLEKKSSVDIPNFAGNTAFLAANTRGYHEIAKLLAENGADTRGLMNIDEMTFTSKISPVKSQLKNKLVSVKSGQTGET